MRPGAIVILQVGIQNVTQIPLSEDDHVIKTSPSDRTYQSFTMPVLPGRSHRGRLIANAHRAKTSLEDFAIDAISITDEISRRLIPTTGFGDLMSDPTCGRMFSRAQL